MMTFFDACSMLWIRSRSAMPQNLMFCCFAAPGAREGGAERNTPTSTVLVEPSTSVSLTFSLPSIQMSADHCSNSEEWAQLLHAHSLRFSQNIPKQRRSSAKNFLGTSMNQLTHVPLLEFGRMSTVAVATMGCDRLTDWPDKKPRPSPAPTPAPSHQCSTAAARSIEPMSFRMEGLTDSGPTWSNHVQPTETSESKVKAMKSSSVTKQHASIFQPPAKHQHPNRAAMAQK